MKFGPTYKIKSVFQLDIKKLKEDNIKLIIFDADCTLIEDKAFFVEEKMMNKILEFEKAGFSVVIASNGKIHRINKVFKEHPIKAYPMCLKPLPFKLKKIMKGYKKSEVVLVGDQLFTDILCANFAGIKSYMVLPFGSEKGFFMKLKRRVEKLILGDYSKWE